MDGLVTLSATTRRRQRKQDRSHQPTDDLMSAFIAAREAPTTEREAVIASCCAGDADFERELRTLLGDDARSRKHTLYRDTQLQEGRYRLQQELGRGGSSSVWLAYDNKLQREIVLKVLERSSGDEAFQDALREARAASPIVHDHVCRVLDVDVCPERQTAYIVMETCRERRGGQWLDAVSLRDCTPRNRREAVSWTMQIARGVEAAHQQGVFHGDLKPANVMIRPLSRRAQVIDFGLARHFVAGRATSSENGKLLIVGTPAYMAPEQAAGLPCNLDPEIPEDHRKLCSIDVYAVGALLYEQLSGRVPYAARAGAKDPDSDVMQQVLDSPPPVLGGLGARLRGERFYVPPRLRRILDKAMQRDPQRRYRSSEALADDLDRYLDNQATSLDGRRATLGLWMVRNARASLLGLTILAVLALLVYGQWLGTQVEAAQGSLGLYRAQGRAQQALEAEALAREQRDAVAQQSEQLERRVQQREQQQASMGQELLAEKARTQRLFSKLRELQVPQATVQAQPAKAGEAATASATPAKPADGAPKKPQAARAAKPAPRKQPPSRRVDERAVYLRVQDYLDNATRDALVVELRDTNERLVGLWARNLPYRGATLKLEAAQRGELARLLRNRKERHIWRVGPAGRVIERCSIVRPMTGSRLRRKSCEPVTSPLPKLKTLRFR